MFLLKRTAESCKHLFLKWNVDLEHTHKEPSLYTVLGGDARPVWGSPHLAWDISTRRDTSIDLFWIQWLEDGVSASKVTFMKIRQNRNCWGLTWEKLREPGQAGEWESSGTDNSDLDQICSFHMQICSLLYSWHLHCSRKEQFRGASLSQAQVSFFSPSRFFNDVETGKRY